MARIHIIYFDINTGYFPGVNHGLASLAAVTRKNNHFFSFHHLTKLEDLKVVVKMTIRENPDVIGFSFTTNQRQYVQKYAEAFYQNIKALQIAGGIHPTINPQGTFKIKSIQGVCIGEGEYSILELLNKIDKKEDIYSTPGFWWRKNNGTFIRNSVLPLDPDLSRMPFPDYSIFDTEEIAKASSGWVAMLIIRGCPYNCYYCCNHVLRNIYPCKSHYFRIPPVKYAIKLIRHNLSFYKNPKGINFADDLLTFNPDWFDRFADAYQKEIRLPYTCNSRVESLSDRVVKVLKRKWCKTVYIGVESGNEGIRKKLLNRHHSNKVIIEAFKRVKKAGISSFAYNIVGFPFETKEQMEETLKLNKIIKPTSGTVFYFYPYPGTKLFNICKENNLLLSEEKSKKFSGYLEAPAIKLTNCKESDCIKMYNKIRLFLLFRTMVNILKLPDFFGKVLYWFGSLNPKFLVNIITKNSKFKSIVRKIFYKYFFR